jgi:tagatose 6-phosphate kinase
MARILVVTPNPAVDTTYRVAEQRVGESHRVLEVSQRPGGKGVNVSRGLAALGHESVNILPLGGVSGDWVAARLDELGLAAGITRIAGSTRTCVAVTDPLAHPTVFNEPGPLVTPVEWEALLADVRLRLPDAAMLVVSGSLPPGTDASLITALVVAARDAGVPSLLDVSGESLLAGAAAGADVLKPNAEELLAATGAADLDAAIDAARALGARLVVVSRGSDGLVAHDGGTAYSTPAVPGIHGNPTGAGDAATAGLAAALVDGTPIPEALRWAAALGAAAVLRPVAGEVDLPAFHRFLSTETPTTE